jgi:hypothetical protein
MSDHFSKKMISDILPTMSLKVTVPQQKTVEKQLVDYKAF